MSVHNCCGAPSLKLSCKCTAGEKEAIQKKSKVQNKQSKKSSPGKAVTKTKNKGFRIKKGVVIKVSTRRMIQYVLPLCQLHSAFDLPLCLLNK